jgi:hypothetical protein
MMWMEGDEDAEKILPKKELHGMKIAKDALQDNLTIILI